MLRFGLLGAGRIGQIHGRNIAAAADARLLAIADVDRKAAAALAESTGAEVRDAEAIIAAGDIDAILIGTPTDTHADLIEAGARAGKAVFCEKPVDLASSRVESCLKVVEAAGFPLMIGFNRRFDPNFAALQARVASGAVGSVEIVTVISRDPGPPPISYIGRSGGLYRDMMIHDFDIMRFMLGEEPVELHAYGSALVDPAIGEAGDVDTAVVMLRTESGKLGQISNSRRAAYGYDQRIEVHGSEGLARADNVHESTVEIAGKLGFSKDPVLNFFLERYAEAYRRELAAFIEAVSTGRPPSPSGQDGLRAQRLADAATQSRETGRPVQI
ncbi:MAG: inositol 2-dehydrogenase [Pseudomonadota bacterium]|nr:inositol 2-dehydrogenase [Pseudomonadota bacterium]